MQKISVFVAIAVGLAVVGVAYLKHNAPSQSSTSKLQSSSAGQAVEVSPVAENSPEQTQSEIKLKNEQQSPAKTVPADPRLAALMISPDNGLIEFVRAADGKVIKEIGKDPNSLGFQKPLREYIYVGDQVIGLIAYQYFGGHVQITKTAVSYKPDGSVDKHLESTSHEFGN